MFSKLISRKSSGFEVLVTNNPHWQAPVLLYPKHNTRETKIEKVLHSVDWTYSRGILQI
jgi:hypothetical protein